MLPFASASTVVEAYSAHNHFWRNSEDRIEGHTRRSTVGGVHCRSSSRELSDRRSPPWNPPTDGWRWPCRCSSGPLQPELFWCQFLFNGSTSQISTHREFTNEKLPQYTNINMVKYCVGRMGRIPVLGTSDAFCAYMQPHIGTEQNWKQPTNIP